MEETAIPLYSWFWLVVPMSVVFLLSIVNYIRHRNRTISMDQINSPDKPADYKEHKSHQSVQYNRKKEDSGEVVSGKPRTSGKKSPSASPSALS